MVSEENEDVIYKPLLDVLILVLVEDGLGANEDVVYKPLLDEGLNPCFGGRWSRRKFATFFQLLLVLSLNPCFGGRWSRSWSDSARQLYSKS